MGYIMQDSNQLTQSQARDVLDDTVHNRILILVNESGPTQNSKRKRNCGSYDSPATTVEDPSTRANNTAIHINPPPVTNQSANYDVRDDNASTANSPRIATAVDIT